MSQFAIEMLRRQRHIVEGNLLLERAAENCVIKWLLSTFKNKVNQFIAINCSRKQRI